MNEDGYLQWVTYFGAVAFPRYKIFGDLVSDMLLGTDVHALPRLYALRDEMDKQVNDKQTPRYNTLRMAIRDFETFKLKHPELVK